MLTKDDLIAIGNLFDQKFDQKCGRSEKNIFTEFEKQIKLNSMAVNRLAKDMKVLTNLVRSL